MISGMCRAIAVRYGRRPGASREIDIRMVTTEVSVSWVAKPSPGKCFIDGMTPFDSSPVANAFDSDAVWTALNDQVRPCAIHERGGRRGHVGDRSEIDVDAERPQRRTRARTLGPRDGRAVEPAHRGTDSVGGAHGMRLIDPPSWSTAMSRGGWPPAFAVAWSLAVRAIRAVRVVMLDRTG